MPEPSTGFVAMLDALGIRNSSIQEAEDFINKRNEILSFVDPKLRQSIISRPLEEQKIREEKFEEPEQITFGDTIILTWEIPEENIELSHFFDLYWYLSSYIYKGMENAIYLRGSLDYGKYLVDQDKRSVLGPVMAEVATWYENANWIGVIGTPRFSLLFEEYFNQDDNNGYGYRKYEVPLKNEEYRSLWTVEWPRIFKGENDDWPSAREEFFNFLRNDPIPPRATDVYSNTVEYFDHLKMSDQDST